MQATVVDGIKGSRQVGESLSFKRVSDSRVLDQDAEGRTFVDSQDPQALYEFTVELQTIVAKCKREDSRPVILMARDLPWRALATLWESAPA